MRKTTHYKLIAMTYHPITNSVVLTCITNMGQIFNLVYSESLFVLKYDKEQNNISINHYHNGSLSLISHLLFDKEIVNFSNYGHYGFASAARYNLFIREWRKAKPKSKAIPFSEKGWIMKGTIESFNENISHYNKYHMVEIFNHQHNYDRSDNKVTSRLLCDNNTFLYLYSLSLARPQLYDATFLITEELWNKIRT